MSNASKHCPFSNVTFSWLILCPTVHFEALVCPIVCCDTTYSFCCIDIHICVCDDMFLILPSLLRDLLSLWHPSHQQRYNIYWVWREKAHQLNDLDQISVGIQWIGAWSWSGVWWVGTPEGYCNMMLHCSTIDLSICQRYQPSHHPPNVVTNAAGSNDSRLTYGMFELVMDSVGGFHTGRLVGSALGTTDQWFLHPPLRGRNGPLSHSVSFLVKRCMAKFVPVYCRCELAKNTNVWGHPASPPIVGIASELPIQCPESEPGRKSTQKLYPMRRCRYAARCVAEVMRPWWLYPQAPVWGISHTGWTGLKLRCEWSGRWGCKQSRRWGYEQSMRWGHKWSRRWGHKWSRRWGHKWRRWGYPVFWLWGYNHRRGGAHISVTWVPVSIRVGVSIQKGLIIK